MAATLYRLVYRDASNVLHSDVVVYNTSTDVSPDFITLCTPDGNLGYVKLGTVGSAIQSNIRCVKTAGTVLSVLIGGGPAGTGYAMGGVNSGYVGDIDGYLFATDTFVNPTSSISVGRDDAAGVNNATYGYAIGGFYGTFNAANTTVDRLTFAGETCTTVSIGAPWVARGVSGGVSSSTNGYVLGGIDTNRLYQTSVFTMPFASQTMTLLGTGLSAGVKYGAGVGSTTLGYCVGGQINDSFGYTTAIDKITYSSGTVAASGHVLGYAREGCGVNSTTHGFVVAGSALQTTLEDIDLGTGTATSRACLVDPRNYAAGMNSNTDGYCYGGVDNGGGWFNDAAKFGFTTYTGYRLASHITTSISHAVGVQSGGYL